MREGQQQSWIIRLINSFLKEAPYSLFFVGAIVCYAYGDIPWIFRVARYIKMRPNLNT
jgi:hypothetical protein